MSEKIADDENELETKLLYSRSASSPVEVQSETEFNAYFQERSLEMIKIHGASEFISSVLESSSTLETHS